MNYQFDPYRLVVTCTCSLYSSSPSCPLHKKSDPDKTPVGPMPLTRAFEMAPPMGYPKINPEDECREPNCSCAAWKAEKLQHVGGDPSEYGSEVPPEAMPGIKAWTDAQLNVEPQGIRGAPTPNALRQFDFSSENLQENQAPSDVKLDQGKVPMGHIPLFLLEDVARVFEYGARKYAPQGWRQKGTKADVIRYIGACLRHLRDYQKGYELDHESGLPHLAHAIASLLMGADLAAGNGVLDSLSD